MRVLQLPESPQIAHSGCGPLIAPLTDSLRPMRQQVFDRVRALGLISRAQVAKDLGVSPASVTPCTHCTSHTLSQASSHANAFTTFSLHIITDLSLSHSLWH